MPDGFKYERGLRPPMGDVQLNPPDERQCLVCGREDVWDEESEEWRIRVVEGEKIAGNRFCMHEWDITGTHRPILE